MSSAELVPLQSKSSVGHMDVAEASAELRDVSLAGVPAEPPAAAVTPAASPLVSSGALIELPSALDPQPEVARPQRQSLFRRNRGSA